jgi:hypothetical protein
LVSAGSVGRLALFDVAIESGTNGDEKEIAADLRG